MHLLDVESMIPYVGQLLVLITAPLRSLAAGSALDV